MSKKVASTSELSPRAYSTSSVATAATPSPGILQFSKLWETLNPVNLVYNSVPKDDPPETPKNRLFLVTFGVGNPHKLSLEMVFPSGEDQTKWLCAAFWGPNDKVPGSDARFSSDSKAHMVFNHYPTPDPNSVEDQSRIYQIMYGRDVNNDGILAYDNANYIKIPQIGNEILDVRAFSGVDYFYCWAQIVGGSTSGTGWWTGKPFTVRLLRIFKDGSTANLESMYLPTLTRDVTLNCLDPASPFVDWLTHNAGANFATNGVATLKEYVWDAATAFSQFAAGAPQFADSEAEFFWDNWDTILPDWGSLPVGYSAWTDWYTLVDSSAPITVALGDSVAQDDLFTAFARVRLVSHRVKYHVVKSPLSSLPIIDGYHRTGELQDLYDFNVLTAYPGWVAAVVQLGYGNGSAGAPGGKIYRDRFFFEKISSP